MNTDAVIIKNKKAHFDYIIEDRFEAGLVLCGWEIKSLRAGRVNLSDAHVIVRRGEAWLLGSQLQPLPTADLQPPPEPDRTRKLLLTRRELNRLIGLVERQGYTLIPLSLYWKKNYVKAEIALAKGKKVHDKRETSKARDWERTRARLMKKQRSV